MSARSLPEWIGKSPDEPVPPRVRARVFGAFGGRCPLCTRKILTGERWVLDHIIALINGGEHRETNFQPICGWCDRNVKTPADVAKKSKIADQREKHLGIRKPRTITRWRKFNGEIVVAERER
jgi:5-methylcytosine-specific restriction endonuclease McrA